MFVRNELSFEKGGPLSKQAYMQIKKLFDCLVRLLMVFDEDLMDKLLSRGFFSTFIEISKFVIKQRPNWKVSGNYPFN